MSHCLVGPQDRNANGLVIRLLDKVNWTLSRFCFLIGSRCDDCASGFFGNPSDFGGSCQPCQCHHNIDTTDPEACDKETGRCLKCLYHTEGDHCQLCRDGYYGDALRQDCRSKMHIHLACPLQWSPPPPPPFFNQDFTVGMLILQGETLVQQGKISHSTNERWDLIFFLICKSSFFGKTSLKMWPCARGTCGCHQDKCHAVECMVVCSFHELAYWVGFTDLNSHCGRAAPFWCGWWSRHLP